MRLTTLGIVLLAIATAAGAQTQKKDVEIAAADGITLKGTYFSPGRPGPAMLLLHQCNMDRHAWDGLAGDLAAAGVHVLALDFRGFGDSGGGPFDFSRDRAVMAEKWPGDVDAALAFLLRQSGVDPTRVAAGGASCGVTQSADLAARNRNVKALVLLSGVASDAATTHVGGTPGLPVFGAAAEGDARAADAIKAVAQASKHPESTLKIYSGSEHGVPMFAANPDLQPMIVSWLTARLK
jgi:dienelactone hydrolase